MKKNWAYVMLGNLSEISQFTIINVNRSFLFDASYQFIISNVFWIKVSLIFNLNRSSTYFRILCKRELKTWQTLFNRFSSGAFPFLTIGFSIFFKMSVLYFLLSSNKIDSFQRSNSFLCLIIHLVTLKFIQQTWIL